MQKLENDRHVNENRIVKAMQMAGKSALVFNLGTLIRLARFGPVDMHQRLRDMFETIDPFEVRDRVTKLPKSHDITIMIQTYCEGQGLEIGPGSNPYCPIDRTTFVDKFEQYDLGMKVQKIEDAWNLPFPDNHFDFVMASHVLEHCPDTIRTLLEWGRVVRPGGKIVVVLPHGGRIFDAGRQFTTLSHHLADYMKVDIDDPDPWDEFERISIPALHHFWMDNPHAKLPDGQWNREWICKNGLIHYHVWRAKEMCELFQYIGCQVLDSSERLAQRTDSFAVVAQVHKDNKYFQAE